MPGPLLPLLAPLLPALLIFVGLRRWPRAAAVCGFLSALLIGVLLATIDLQETIASSAIFAGAELRFFGWILLLTEGLRRLLLLMYGASALLFLASGLWPQSSVFVPAALASLSPLAFALMITPLAFGAVALLLAAAFLAVLVQGRRAGSTVASLRYVLLTALALPVFLIAGWMLDSQQLALGGALWRLFFLGATLLLAGFPFHIWVRPLLNETHPLTAAFVLAPAQLVILTFIWRWLQQNPDLLANTPIDVYMGWSGAATALAAALLAFNERDPRRLLGALVLADMGATLICLGQGLAGIEQAWALIVLRFVGLLIAAAGIELVARVAGDDAIGTDAEHLARRPLAAALFTYGALSLIGLPLTPGFAARWAAIALGGAVSIWWALALLVAIAGGLAGVLRVLGPVLAHLHDGAQLAGWPTDKRSRLAAVAMSSAFLIVLALSLYPWPLLHLFSRLNELF